jgi:hypothetical protein
VHSVRRVTFSASAAVLVSFLLPKVILAAIAYCCRDVATCGLTGRCLALALSDKQDVVDPVVDTQDISGVGSSCHSGNWFPFYDSFTFYFILCSAVVTVVESEMIS